MRAPALLVARPPVKPAAVQVRAARVTPRPPRVSTLVGPSPAPLERPVAVHLAVLAVGRVGPAGGQAAVGRAPGELPACPTLAAPGRRPRPFTARAGTSVGQARGQGLPRPVAAAASAPPVWGPPPRRRARACAPRQPGLPRVGPAPVSPSAVAAVLARPPAAARLVASVVP